MNPIIAFAFVSSLILQGSLISFPLVFILLTILAVKNKKIWIFPFSFVLGLILDSFYLKTLGGTSTFFLIFLFAVFAYERKFETNSVSFIFISSFLGSMILFLILGDSNFLFKSIFTAVVTYFLSRIW